MEVKDKVSIKLITEEQKQALRDRRNRMYKDIVNANLGLNVEFIKMLDDNAKISFIEEAYKCVDCRDSDECKQCHTFMQPNIEQYENSFISRRFGN